MIKGKYKHYKGKKYQVLDVVKHSETLEELVLYKQLYGDYSLWVRPLNMFNEEIFIDGKWVKRFELIAD
jgi:hypothetical protein